jgi:hypothetical protein
MIYDWATAVLVHCFLPRDVVIGEVGLPVVFVLFLQGIVTGAGLLFSITLFLLCASVMPLGVLLQRLGVIGISMILIYTFYRRNSAVDSKCELLAVVSELFHECGSCI